MHGGGVECHNKARGAKEKETLSISVDSQVAHVPSKLTAHPPVPLNGVRDISNSWRRTVKVGST